MTKLKPHQAGELRADAVRDGTWFLDEVESKEEGGQLGRCAVGKERCVGVVHQL